MYDLAGLAIAAACFAFAFLLDLGAGARLMSAGDVFGLVISIARLRLPRVRAVPG